MYFLDPTVPRNEKITMAALLLVIFAGMLLLDGCASHEVLLKNPTTGEKHTCWIRTTGIIATTMSQGLIDRCVNSWKAVGYTDVYVIE
jgi:hypothetical protein